MRSQHHVRTHISRQTDERKSRQRHQVESRVVISCRNDADKSKTGPESQALRQRGAHESESRNRGKVGDGDDDCSRVLAKTMYLCIARHEKTETGKCVEAVQYEAEREYRHDG